MRLHGSVRHMIKDVFGRVPRHYGHLTELRSRSLDRHTCRVMTPDEHALMGALAAARNEDRSTDSS